MKSQAAKNIRQAFPLIVFASPEWLATQAAAKWVADGAPACPTLVSLDLFDLAHRCLIGGETLEDVGAGGPYGTAAQRRAWASGRLAVACHAIHVNEALTAHRRATSERIAELERKLEYARAETRAAARFKDVVVPFREPRRQKSVDWDAV